MRKQNVFKEFKNMSLIKHSFPHIALTLGKYLIYLLPIALNMMNFIKNRAVLKG